MGRHKAMPSAEEPHEPDQSGSVPGPTPEPIPDRLRRLTVRTVPDRDRYERLKTLSISKPPGPLRAQAIERAALVQAHTPPIDEGNDRKNARTIARFLYDEALTAGYVDEQRALTRKNVDKWVYKDHSSLSEHTQGTYRIVMYAAGLTIYPREFPAPLPRGTRTRATPAARPGTVEELYATAVAVPEVLRPRMVLILDLITGAGLRSQEVREITGSDISVMRLDDGREIAVVRVRRRGKVDRVIPVLCPRRGHRLLVRAAEVGTGPLYPLTSHGTVSKNAVSRVNDRLREYGFQGLDAAALRNRWILDLAASPGIPTAVLLTLAGIGDLRVLADQAALLPTYRAEQLAEILREAQEGSHD